MATAIEMAIDSNSNRLKGQRQSRWQCRLIDNGNGGVVVSKLFKMAGVVRRISTGFYVGEENVLNRITA
jgi:hypothetical protein